MPATRLSSIAVDWMWENPSELTPDNTQITELRAILALRPDAGSPDIGQLFVACDDYLKV
ncbi:hypothetical protein [Rhodanobacter sp. Root561]|uniref:hypothetical protein n=1 Tax=Rhodanobacter sp. Root561 TaxID=1736560 RepID=UPI000AF7AD33|nr:hypothetical protein [Rhodanobacter sp. Root561]